MVGFATLVPPRCASRRGSVRLTLMGSIAIVSVGCALSVAFGTPFPAATATVLGALGGGLALRRNRVATRAPLGHFDEDTGSADAAILLPPEPVFASEPVSGRTMIPVESVVQPLAPEPVAIHPDGTPPARPRVAPRVAPAWVDRERLLHDLGGDKELLAELVACFAEDLEPRLQGLFEAATAGDAASVSRAAHGVQSGLSNFCAPGARALAAELERACRDGLPVDVVDEVERIAAASEGVLAELQDMIGELAA